MKFGEELLRELLELPNFRDLEFFRGQELLHYISKFGNILGALQGIFKSSALLIRGKIKRLNMPDRAHSTQLMSSYNISIFMV